MANRILIVRRSSGKYHMYGPELVSTDRPVSALVVDCEEAADPGDYARRLSRAVRRPWRQLLRRRPIGEGFIHPTGWEQLLAIAWPDLSRLIERFAGVIDCHPLIWLGDLADAAGIHPANMLAQLLAISQDRDNEHLSGYADAAANT